MKTRIAVRYCTSCGHINGWSECARCGFKLSGIRMSPRQARDIRQAYDNAKVIHPSRKEWTKEDQNVLDLMFPSADSISDLIDEAVARAKKEWEGWKEQK